MFGHRGPIKEGNISQFPYRSKGKRLPKRLNWGFYKLRTQHWSQLWVWLLRLRQSDQSIITSVGVLRGSYKIRATFRRYSNVVLPALSYSRRCFISPWILSTFERHVCRLTRPSISIRISFLAHTNVNNRENDPPIMASVRPYFPLQASLQCRASETEQISYYCRFY